MILFYILAALFIVSSVNSVQNIREEPNELIEECKVIGPEFIRKFELIEYYSDIFYTLNDQLNTFSKAQEKKSVNMVILLGNPGAGKSTLAQFLTDVEKLTSVETPSNSGNFIIAGNDKIGNEIIESKTLFPELIIDSDTRNMICDSPGFRDTRSTMHELIAASSMKKILNQTEKIKIALVIPETSLMKGSYRDDFTDLLKHTTSFVKHFDYYKKSFYLVATKGNSYVVKDNATVKVCEEFSVDQICDFLKEVKSSMEKHSPSLEGKKDHKDAIDIISTILGRPKTRILLFRKPTQEGPLINISDLMTERSTLRKALLSDINFSLINENDFGYSVSDQAKNYLNELFSLGKEYIISLSDLLSKYIVTVYENKLNEIKLMDERIDEIKRLKDNTYRLINETHSAANAKQYFNVIKSFMDFKNISDKCKNNLNKAGILINFLDNLDNFLKSPEYKLSGWSGSFHMLSDFIHNETVNNYLIEDAFRALTSYEIQNYKKMFYLPVITPWADTYEGNTINEHTLPNLLTFLNLSKKYGDVKLNELTMKILSSATDLAIKTETKSYYINDTLHFSGYIVRLSEIEDRHFKNDVETNRLVIIALHTVFIDKDLDQDYLKGKEILIIAPMWNVIGSRRISVDGRPGNKVLPPKAVTGEIGKDGADGENAGIFIGIGMTFENGRNLIISANGGDGQTGGDGGDGLQGSDGRNGVKYSETLSGTSKTILLIYNRFVKKTVLQGTFGDPGGDSGAGGEGGKGGKNGTVKLYNLGANNDGVSIKVKDGIAGSNGKDGIPGRGGQGGCEISLTEISEYLLIIPVSSVGKQLFGNCLPRNRSGTVKRMNNNLLKYHGSQVIKPSKVTITCQFLKEYYSFYNSYRSIFFDATFEKFKENIQNKILAC
ncbi:uncharacterized protein LOC142324464 [Lycorma delicatula]|uniref:uncharacterized protein LOC142324464 n=1 Tax=Lycorma delicatula TaxID=130591 RepID=UPI003F51A3E1